MNGVQENGCGQSISHVSHSDLCTHLLVIGSFATALRGPSNSNKQTSVIASTSLERKVVLPEFEYSA